MTKTVDELRTQKLKLEADILALIRAFQTEFDVSVASLGLESYELNAIGLEQPRLVASRVQTKVRL